MSRQKMKKHAIYVLLNKSDNTFFVWYCDAKNVYDAFRLHYNLKVLKTKNWIDKIKLNQQKPCVFILEIIEGTRKDCYSLSLIWSKIFIENNLKSIETESILTDIVNIHDHNLSKYEERKAIDLGSLLDCKNCILPVYKSIYCPHYIENNVEKLKQSPRNTVRLHVSIEEQQYKVIESKATEVNKKVNQYIIESALNNEIRVINFEVVHDFIDKSNKLCKMLNAYIITLLSTDTYEPAHIEHLQKSVDDLKKNQKKIIRLINKQIKEMSQTNLESDIK